MYSLQAHLPAPMQTVFKLFTKHQFDLSEIANIHNCTVEEVEKIFGCNARTFAHQFFESPQQFGLIEKS